MDTPNFIDRSRGAAILRPKESPSNIRPLPSALGIRVIARTTNKKVSKMKPREQFALALRIIGLLGIVYVLRSFVRSPVAPTLIVVLRLVGVLIGAYFIRGASLLVKFAYPESTPEPSEKAHE